MELELLYPLINIFTHSHPMWRDLRTQVPNWAAVCNTHATETIDWMEAALEGREFLATDNYTVADITGQCALLIGKAGAFAWPGTHSNLTSWWGRVTSRPMARA